MTSTLGKSPMIEVAARHGRQLKRIQQEMRAVEKMAGFIEHLTDHSSQTGIADAMMLGSLDRIKDDLFRISTHLMERHAEIKNLENLALQATDSIGLFVNHPATHR
jgi:hypothetical protein